MSKDLFKDLLKEANSDLASIVDDGVIAGDVNSYIDTSSYSFNALLSGSIWNGIPGNKVIALAGETSTGKTFFALSIVKQFLKDNPTGFVFYFESESALSKEMLKSRGLDVKRIVISPVVTVQQFRTQASNILDKYIDTPKKDRPPMMFVLDSLGNLSTTKEIEDIAEGKETRDMTRAQLIKGAFRVLTLKLGLANVPLIVTNHIYAVIGSYVPTQKQGGGSGLDYAASVIVFLRKKSNKDEDKNVIGQIITATLDKSRLTQEKKKVEMLLRYDTGIDRYYGLIDLCLKFELWKKISTQIEIAPDTKVYEKNILDNPEKFFTKELLEKIDEACKNEFLYGKTSVANVTET